MRSHLPFEQRNYRFLGFPFDARDIFTFCDRWFFSTNHKYIGSFDRAFSRFYNISLWLLPASLILLSYVEVGAGTGPSIDAKFIMCYAMPIVAEEASENSDASVESTPTDLLIIAICVIGIIIILVYWGMGPKDSGAGVAGAVVAAGAESSH